MFLALICVVFVLEDCEAKRRFSKDRNLLGSGERYSESAGVTSQCNEITMDNGTTTIPHHG